MGQVAAAGWPQGSNLPPPATPDLGAYSDHLDQNWHPDRLIDLLTSPAPIIVDTAIAALGKRGTMNHCRALLSLLRDAAEGTAQRIEDALWSIWMRAGSERGNQMLASAVSRIKAEDYPTASRRLTALEKAEPTFAEAWHQHGLVYCLQERLDEASRAFQQALSLNPDHFGAVAGLGHIAAQSGDVDGALRYYRRALEIHPRLEGIPETVEYIESALARRGRRGCDA